METVSAHVDDLGLLAGTLAVRSIELGRLGVEVSSAIQHLMSTRSEFIGTLIDHGSVLNTHRRRIEGLGTRVRFTAGQFHIADTGPLQHLRTVTGSSGPPKPTGPPEPESPTGPVKPKTPSAGKKSSWQTPTKPGPNNWAGLDPELIKQGQQLAARVKAQAAPLTLSDDQMTQLAAWWFDANQHDEDRPLRAIVEKLAPADLARLRDRLSLFAWNAYGNAKDRVPVEFDEVMEFLSTPAAAKLNPGQLAAEVRRRFPGRDSDTLNAINTVLRFEIGTANRLLDPSRGEIARGDLIWGWYVPGLVPAPWSDSLARSYDHRAVTPDRVDDQAAVIMRLLQGQVLTHDDRAVAAIRPPQKGPGGVMLLAVLAGAAAAALVAALAPEAAITAAVVAALEAIPATAAAAPLIAPSIASIITAALIGATGGATAGMVGRTVSALITGEGWGEVLDPDTVARDALLGGILAMAAYGLGQAITKVKAKLATTNPNTKGYKDLEEELRALEAAYAKAGQTRRAFTTESTPPDPVPVADLKPVTTGPAKDFGNTVGSKGSVASSDDIALIGRKISPQAQARHIKGTPQWLDRGSGGYFLNESDAQAVLDAVHQGKATVLGRTSNGQLLVRYDSVTGYNNNSAAGFVDQPTHVFIIKGTQKVSVVPTSPRLVGTHD